MEVGLSDREGEGLARSEFGRRTINALVTEGGGHVGSYRLQKRRECCTWVSKRWIAVKTAAKVFMAFVWIFHAWVECYRRYFLDM